MCKILGVHSLTVKDVEKLDDVQVATKHRKNLQEFAKVLSLSTHITPEEAINENSCDFDVEDLPYEVTIHPDFATREYSRPIGYKFLMDGKGDKELNIHFSKLTPPIEDEVTGKIDLGLIKMFIFFVSPLTNGSYELSGFRTSFKKHSTFLLESKKIPKGNYEMWLVFSPEKDDHKEAKIKIELEKM